MKGLQVGQYVTVTDFPEYFTRYPETFEKCLKNNIPMVVEDRDGIGYLVKATYGTKTDSLWFLQAAVVPYTENKFGSFYEQKYFFWDTVDLVVRLEDLRRLEGSSCGIIKLQIEESKGSSSVIKSQMDCIEKIIKGRDYSV